MALGGLPIEGMIGLATWEPARHHEMEAPSTALCRFLEGDEHALGIGLLEIRQPTQPEHEHVMLSKAQIATQEITRALIGSLLAQSDLVNAQRQQGQLGPRRARFHRNAGWMVLPAIQQSFQALTDGG